MSANKSKRWEGINRRGNKLWWNYRLPDGERVFEPSGFEAGQEAEAHTLLKKIKAQFAAARRLGVTSGPVTVRAFAAQWLDGRRDLPSHKADEGRLRLHALPDLGRLAIGDVKPRHLVELVAGLRAKGELSPRSIHHVYGLLHVMFRDAQLEELIAANPCILTKKQLGQKRDKDPEWRATAIYSRDELEALISDARIAADRQLLYALAGLAGLRFGEIAGLCWRHYDPDARPLGRLVVANSNDREGTKTGVTREVPIHPTLAAMLAAWKLSGWAELFGRYPGPDDFLLPSRRAVRVLDDGAEAPGMRNKHTALEVLHDDLAKLGRRQRRFHDLRRTMISLARADGARPDILKTVTHGQSGNILDVYTTLPWEAVCTEVRKLRVERYEGRVVELPRVAQVAGMTSGHRGGGDSGGDSLSEAFCHKGKNGDPDGIRTHVPSVRGWCPNR